MAQTNDIKVLGIAGSLRKGSYNASALREAVRLAPPGMRIELAGIADIELYNEDVYAAGFPPAVDRLREQIRGADALLLVTPEYNASIPGVLTNAIDWVSRPPEQPFAGKPAAIMGASPGRLGTARAQNHLRQTLIALDARVLNSPLVFISEAHKAFDEAGNLTAEATQKYIGNLLAALRDWTLKLKH